MPRANILKSRYSVKHFTFFLYLCLQISPYVSKKTNKSKVINIRNKRAEFDFLLIDDYTAGIVLTGTEIKSIRQGKASLVDTFCFIHNGEVWVKNMYVSHYKEGSYNNHMERRERKLLLNRREIDKLSNAVKSPGYSIIPTLLWIDDNGRAKLDISLCRGKKEYDKRQTEKEKELKDIVRRATYK